MGDLIAGSNPSEQHDPPTWSCRQGFSPGPLWGACPWVEGSPILAGKAAGWLDSRPKDRVTFGFRKTTHVARWHWTEMEHPVVPGESENQCRPLPGISPPPPHNPPQCKYILKAQSFMPLFCILKVLSDPRALSMQLQSSGPFSAFSAYHTQSADLHKMGNPYIDFISCVLLHVWRTCVCVCVHRCVWGPLRRDRIAERTSR